MWRSLNGHAGVRAACAVAGWSAAIVLAAGLVLAVITPDNSILGAAGVDVSLITEAFRQAVGTLLTPMYDPGLLLLGGSRRLHPLLALAIPLTALIVMTRRELHRTEGAKPLTRLAWAAGAAVPFGLLMLLFAVLGGHTPETRIDPSAGSAFALGLLWGAVGGAVGAATKLRLVTRVPRAVRAALATLRPLAAVLVVFTALALAGWLIQVARDAGGVRAGRGTLTALVEEAAFAGEHGIHLTGLAAGGRFRADADGALGLPFPVADAERLPGRDGTFRIFDYEGALPGFVFVPALIVLIGLLTLAALAAGFAAARAARAGSPGAAVAWGALTGPAWALAMAVLMALAGGLFHGDADDLSVFGLFLAGGAVLGAAGGAFAVSAGSPAASVRARP
ncbi:MAG TPA: hypothetical protein VNS09_13135 [Solirubrobacter sp.]|nr:hypothetical protein [Solirubrobacter sp.]